MQNLEELKNIEAIENYPLKQHTTLKVGGNADCAYFPKDFDEVVQIIRVNKALNNAITILGAGSNVLVSSRGVEGAVILTKNLSEIYLDESGFIHAQAGVKSATFSQFAHSHSMKGAEFLIGIPGFIGGAIFMNAGAHGQNIKGILHSAKILDIETCDITTVMAEDLELEYRHSAIIVGKHVILEGIFKLENGNEEEIKKLMDFHVDYRAKTHPPLTQPSAGSTFRNPEGKYAALLMLDIGAPSWKVGGVQVSQKHTNFLHNFDDATSDEISELIFKMYSEVKNHYGIEMTPEIKYIGRLSKEEEKIWNIFAKH